MVIDNYRDIHQDLVQRIKNTKSARDAAVLIAERIKVLDKILVTASSSDVILAGVENAERIIRDAQESKDKALMQLSELAVGEQETGEIVESIGGNGSSVVSSSSSDSSIGNDSGSSSSVAFTTADGSSGDDSSSAVGSSSSSSDSNGDSDSDSGSSSSMVVGSSSIGSAVGSDSSSGDSDSMIESFERIREQMKNKNENGQNENELDAPTIAEYDTSTAATTSSEKGAP
jgi:hypothetical protein